MFATLNDDALSTPADNISQGRRLGFLAAFEASYDEQTRYYSQFGAEVSLREEEQENVQRIRRIGAKPPPSLNSNEDGLFSGMTGGLDSAPYRDYMSGIVSGDDDGIYKALGDRDDKLRALQQQYPNAGIRTYDDMFKTVREKSDAARRRASLDTTLGGMVGSFAGAAVGGVNPVVNPLAFATLPVGAFGAD